MAAEPVSCPTPQSPAAARLPGLGTSSSGFINPVRPAREAGMRRSIPVPLDVVLLDAVREQADPG
ncbi:hypothetical protein GCM10009634_75240 [Saccharothrix xinjiangensis]